MNLYKFLKTKLIPQPTTVSQAQIAAAVNDPAQQEVMRKFGVVTADLRKVIEDQTLVLYERSQIYQAIDRSLSHALMSAATSMFADVATTRSSMHDATVWVDTDSKEYQYQIEKMFDIINLEEVIYDWAWTIATFGDLFVQIYGEPGVGIVSVNDDAHPVNISRVDYNGRLIGFYDTPAGYTTADERKLLTPWDYVHFRLLGAKRRRPLYNDPMYSEFRTISIMAPDVRRLTNKYGTSVLTDALPVFKRLRLAEDSIMMSRITRGVMRYIYKIGVSGANNEAISGMIDQYVSELKRARAMDTSEGGTNFSDKYNPPAALEDIILPVWGDVNQIAVEKLGGDVDIKWIVDVEELRNQLATALKVPLPLLAGYADKANGGLGQNSLERLDIRFARQARRVQRGIINGLTRMAQIHLAYQGINPDLNLFTIQMAETSTAEEEELKDALDKGVDICTKFTDLLEKMFGMDIDKEKAFDYLNKKFLKLNDFDLTTMLKPPNANAFEGPTKEEGLVPGVETPGTQAGEAPITPTAGEATPAELGLPSEENPFKESHTLSDFKSMLPKLNEAKWTEQWGTTKVKVKPFTAGTK